MILGLAFVISACGQPAAAQDWGCITKGSKPVAQGEAMDADAVALKVLLQACQCVGPQRLVAEAQLTPSPRPEQGVASPEGIANGGTSSHHQHCPPTSDSMLQAAAKGLIATVPVLVPADQSDKLRENHFPYP